MGPLAARPARRVHAGRRSRRHLPARRDRRRRPHPTHRDLPPGPGVPRREALPAAPPPRRRHLPRAGTPSARPGSPSCWTSRPAAGRSASQHRQGTFLESRPIPRGMLAEAGLAISARIRYHDRALTALVPEDPRDEAPRNRFLPRRSAPGARGRAGGDRTRAGRVRIGRGPGRRRHQGPDRRGAGGRASAPVRRSGRGGCRRAGDAGPRRRRDPAAGRRRGHGRAARRKGSARLRHAVEQSVPRALPGRDAAGPDPRCRDGGRRDLCRHGRATGGRAAESPGPGAPLRRPRRAGRGAAEGNLPRHRRRGRRGGLRGLPQVRRPLPRGRAPGRRQLRRAGRRGGNWGRCGAIPNHPVGSPP